MICHSSWGVHLFHHSKVCSNLNAGFSQLFPLSLYFLPVFVSVLTKTRFGAATVITRPSEHQVSWTMNIFVVVMGVLGMVLVSIVDYNHVSTEWVCRMYLGNKRLFVHWISWIFPDGAEVARWVLRYVFTVLYFVKVIKRKVEQSLVYDKRRRPNKRPNTNTFDHHAYSFTLFPSESPKFSLHNIKTDPKTIWPKTMFTLLW